MRITFPSIARVEPRINVELLCRFTEGKEGNALMAAEFDQYARANRQNKRVREGNMTMPCRDVARP